METTNQPQEEENNSNLKTAVNRTRIFRSNNVFDKQWMSYPEFSSWLVPVEVDDTAARCSICSTELSASLFVLRKHSKTSYHRNMLIKTPIYEKNDRVEDKAISDDKPTPTATALKTYQKNLTETSINNIYEKAMDRGRNYTDKISSDGNKYYGNSINNYNSNTKYIQNKNDSTSNLVVVVNKQYTKDDYDYGNDELNTCDKTMNQNVISVGAIVTKRAPFWKGTAVVNGHVTCLNLGNYDGRYLVLFFHTQDFTKNEDLIALSDKVDDFRMLNAEVVACSVDSHITHLVWTRQFRKKYSVTKSAPKMPLLSDATHVISKSYGCYLPEFGHSLNAYYIIDSAGVLRHKTISDIPAVWNINEALRLISAFQYTDKTESLCPANWIPGEPTII